MIAHVLTDHLSGLLLLFTIISHLHFKTSPTSVVITFIPCKILPEYFYTYSLFILCIYILCTHHLHFDYICTILKFNYLLSVIFVWFLNLSLTFWIFLSFTYFYYLLFFKSIIYFLFKYIFRICNTFYLPLFILGRFQHTFIIYTM